jgi:F0F1-type ATP synthase assembly protein I
MDSNPGGPPPLQFDTAVPHSTSSSVTAQGVSCAVCRGAVVNEYFDVNGQSVCAGCRTQLEQLAQTPRGWGLFAKAGVFGLVAAILGAILYYAVIAITNFEIGIVAIAIGYMVGWAIRKATDGRGGRRYQVLAVVLTYWAVGLAYTPLTFQQLAEEDKKEQSQGSTERPAPASPAESPDEGAPVSLAMVVAVLLGFSLALPVLAVIGSLPGGLISALIIGIGMRQAWQMTGAATLQISGPYRIAAASPPPAV